MVIFNGWGEQRRNNKAGLTKEPLEHDFGIKYDLKEWLKKILKISVINIKFNSLKLNDLSYSYD